MVNYKLIRNLYYFGIFMLVLYALPGVKLIETYLYPIFSFQIIPGLSVITLIGIATGVGAFMAYQYRTIG
jgi:hypothetical protein